MTLHLQPASGPMENPTTASAPLKFIWSWLITPAVAVYGAFKLLLALVLAALLLAPLVSSAATAPSGMRHASQPADSGHVFIQEKLSPLFR